MVQYFVSNILYFCMNCMFIVVLVVSTGNNCPVSIPESLLQAQEKSCKCMDKVRCIASALGKKPFKKYDVLAEERMDEIGTLLEY
jgi:hypothetical protein